MMVNLDYARIIDDLLSHNITKTRAIQLLEEGGEEEWKKTKI